MYFLPYIALDTNNTEQQDCTLKYDKHVFLNYHYYFFYDWILFGWINNTDYNDLWSSLIHKSTIQTKNVFYSHPTDY